ncbi:MAG TPA: ribbon-helix-helix protein, CopG family [Chloroflexota bacterium]|jgi:predicted transcriptional regulator
MKEVTISARVSEELSQQITTLAQALRRNRSWVIEEAVRGYIQSEQQFIEAVQEGIHADDAGDVLAHDVVMAEAEALLGNDRTSER